MTATPLLDCGEVWDRLSPEQQRAIGKAAVLFVMVGRGQEAALDADDMHRSRFYDIANGVAIEGLEIAGDATPACAVLGFPDLRPFGIQQCRSCGCIEEVACQGGCSWAEDDLCSACVPVMAEAAAE